MKIQIDVDKKTSDLLDAHRKEVFPHLSKRAYFVEMAKQRAEQDGFKHEVNK